MSFFSAGENRLHDALVTPDTKVTATLKYFRFLPLNLGFADPGYRSSAWQHHVQNRFTTRLHHRLNRQPEIGRMQTQTSPSRRQDFIFPSPCGAGLVLQFRNERKLRVGKPAEFKLLQQLHLPLNRQEHSTASIALQDLRFALYRAHCVTVHGRESDGGEWLRG